MPMNQRTSHHTIEAGIPQSSLLFSSAKNVIINEVAFTCEFDSYPERRNRV